MVVVSKGSFNYLKRLLANILRSLDVIHNIYKSIFVFLARCLHILLPEEIVTRSKSVEEPSCELIFELPENSPIERLQERPKGSPSIRCVVLVRLQKNMLHCSLIMEN